MPATPLDRHDEPTPLVKTPAGPRLGIVHVLLWMAGSALLLPFFLGVEGPANESPVGHTVREIIHVAQSMIFGAAMAGLSLFYFYRRRNSSYPSQPGHWLLLLLAAGVLVRWTTSFFGRPLGDDFVFEEMRVWLIARQSIWTAAESLMLLVAGVGLIRSRDLFWAVAMLASLPLALLELFGWMVEYDFLPGVSFYSLVGNYSAVLPFPAVLAIAYTKVTLPALGIAAACLVDIFSRTRRDWAHWLGASCFLLAAATAWSWQIWSHLK